MNLAVSSKGIGAEHEREKERERKREREREREGEVSKQGTERGDDRPRYSQAFVSAKAKYKSWFQSVVALWLLNKNWSIDAEIYKWILNDGAAVDDVAHAPCATLSATVVFKPLCIISLKSFPFQPQVSLDVQDEDLENEEADLQPMPRPQTKEELLKLRGSFRNSMHLASYFYNDRQLQLQFRMVYLGCKPTIELYKHVLHTLKQGQDKLPFHFAALRIFVLSIAQFCCRTQP